ncbi:N-acetyltransferase [Alloalcanivorax gelatiniphagus]|uniref:N-acetyltransferase n=1 Tax=Alloalcanivorax gelatiniphagus TaxID=1194167 RepID=A0ABY2XJ78_9GAMM|nr:N-acetyltransferase [Alloalcanivorax gelatiniphagus]TMW11945.1 N-acetyltransferase [Alloalcanivorax gelatiniphagus]
MIRDYRPADIDQVLAIWLAASIEAHHFIEPAFWQSKMGEMRNVYIPASETFVYEDEGVVVGFYSLYENTLAAIFVAPGSQGKGVGSVLLDDAKSRRAKLKLTVYKENAASIRFYRNNGFSVLQEQIDEHTGHSELIMEHRS